MISPARKALRDVRSGVDLDDATDELVALDRAAIRALAKELTLQSSSSLFTATILHVMGRIASIDERSIDSRAVQNIYKEVQQFIPPNIVGSDRNGWIASNLDRLGTQVARSRYEVGNSDVVRVEDAIRESCENDDAEFNGLADVLDGDLDGIAEQKQEYVDRIVALLYDAVAAGDAERACITARVVGCFSSLAGNAVPTLIASMESGLYKQPGGITRVATVLQTLERIGRAAEAAVPAILATLSYDAEDLIGEDGLMIRVMDTLGGIGIVSKDVLGLLEQAASHPADVIQKRAKGTLWKLCIDD